MPSWSLQAILDMGPTAIYPGHGPVIADPVERIRYYIAHRNGREAQILGALERHPEAGLTPLALVALIYKVRLTIFPIGSRCWRALSEEERVGAHRLLVT